MRFRKPKPKPRVWVVTIFNRDGTRHLEVLDACPSEQMQVELIELVRTASVIQVEIRTAYVNGGDSRVEMLH